MNYNFIVKGAVVNLDQYVINEITNRFPQYFLIAILPIATKDPASIR